MPFPPSDTPSAVLPGPVPPSSCWRIAMPNLGFDVHDAFVRCSVGCRIRRCMVGYARGVCPASVSHRALQMPATTRCRPASAASPTLSNQVSHALPIRDMITIQTSVVGAPHETARTTQNNAKMDWFLSRPTRSRLGWPALARSEGRSNSQVKDSGGHLQL